jgi:hypothetical protein
MIALKTLMKTTAFQSLVSQSILYENRKVDPMNFVRSFVNDNNQSNWLIRLPISYRTLVFKTRYNLPLKIIDIITIALKSNYI